MTIQRAVKILSEYNDWRRHDGEPCDFKYTGQDVGAAIDTVIAALGKQAHQYKRGEFVLYQGGIFRIKEVIWLCSGSEEPHLRLSDHLLVGASNVDPITKKNIYEILPF